jgi:hypothetical protein
MQTEHRAQFYVNEGYLCEAAAQFLADGLRAFCQRSDT